MKNTYFDENGHISKIAIKKFKDGTLDDENLVLIAEHISSCEKCADLIANSFNFDELLEAPLGFEEEIENKIKNKKKDNIQFMFYSFRVAMVACIALIVVFSNTLNISGNKKLELNNINSGDLSIVSHINSSLNNFSEKVIKMEVFNNEK